MSTIKCRILMRRSSKKAFVPFWNECEPEKPADAQGSCGRVEYRIVCAGSRQKVTNEMGGKGRGSQDVVKLEQVIGQKDRRFQETDVTKSLVSLELRKSAQNAKAGPRIVALALHLVTANVASGLHESQEKNKVKKNQKGFSLIELLIVVAIILIIAAIAIPNLLRSRMAANEASAVGS